MKKLLLAITLCFSMSVEAKEETYCDGMKELAGPIIRAREAGVTYLRAVKIVVNGEGGSIQEINAALTLVEWAYSIYLPKEQLQRKKEILKFTDEVHKTCKGFENEN